MKSEFMHAKPYWTSEIKTAHKIQRRARRARIEDGRPWVSQYYSYANNKNVRFRKKKKEKKEQKLAIEKRRKENEEELDGATKCDNKLF
jgi:hypothetical protein